MASIDNLSPELRALVHEHGWAIIKAFLDLGVKKPRHIAHLITQVQNGSYNGGRNPAARERKEGEK